jgi:hypothetical protein
MGYPQKIPVDTGAAVTIMSTHLFNRIPSNLRPCLRCTKVTLEAADGKCIAVDGIAEMKLEIGSQTFVWEVYVAPIQDEGLLGFDFLYYFDCAFEVRRGIRINGQWTTCEVQKGPQRATKVSLSEQTIIPALSECVVEGKADLKRFGTRHGVVEPNYCYSVNKMYEDDDVNIIIGNSLIDTTRQDIGVPVRIMNPTNEEIVLYKGTTLGYVAEVKSIENMLVEKEHIEMEQDGQDETIYSICNVHMHSTNASKVEKTDRLKSNTMGSYDFDTSSWCEDLQELYRP